MSSVNLEKIKVNFPYSEKTENLSTGASIIFITPDSERTMCTYLGISSQLSKNDINEDDFLSIDVNYQSFKRSYIVGSINLAELSQTSWFNNKNVSIIVIEQAVENSNELLVENLEASVY